jgi:hypothetical protein
MYAGDIKHVKTTLKEKRSDLSNTNSQSELVDAENCMFRLTIASKYSGGSR